MTSELTTISKQQIARNPRAGKVLTALAIWLDGWGKNTQRAYHRAVTDFAAHYGSEDLAAAKAADVAAWKHTMKRERTIERNGKRITIPPLSDSTVAARLSAVSSFYDYLAQNGLVEWNPVSRVPRKDLELTPYGKAKKITVGEFNAIMAEIDTSTATGARDFAMLFFYQNCGPRRSEVTRLHGRDIRQGSGMMEWRRRAKGGKVDWVELPAAVWQAIQYYLELDGRELAEDEPVFQAAARHLPHVDAKNPQPISGEAINQALKRYAKRAGINPRRVTIHSLRHLAADEELETNGGNVRAVQSLLGHARLTTTEIYVSAMRTQENPYSRAKMQRVPAIAEKLAAMG